MLISDQDLLPKTVKESSSVLDTSLFMEALSFISESDSFIRESITNTIRESTVNRQIIKEEFNKKFDFGGFIKYIFDKFIETLNKLWERFKMLISKLIYSDRTIMKYGKELENYHEGQLKVYFKHYNYTNLDVSIPSPDMDKQFFHEYDHITEKLKNIQDMQSKESIIANLNTIYQEQLKKENEPFFYGTMRKIVTSDLYNSDNLVSEAEFADRLFITFRNQTSEPNTDPISEQDVRLAAKRFLYGKELIKKVENDIKRIEKSSRTVCKMFKDITPKSVLSNYIPIDYDIEYALNMILQLEAGRITKMSNIFVMAFSAKLEAVKEALKQDKKVLYEALKVMKVNGVKSAGEEES